MMVRALERGYHGRLREPGEVFEIGGRRELGSWMEPVTERGRLTLSVKPEKPRSGESEAP